MSAMNQDYAEMITGLPLFQGFTKAGAQMLMEPGEVRELAPGELVFSEGDPADSVLLVLSGKLLVFVARGGQELPLTTSEAGTLLGELGVLCGIPRSASVRTIEASAVLRWSSEAFRRLMLRNTFLSERIFANSLRTIIEKERSLIQSLTEQIPVEG
jgi:CRP/FNR family transcriptional regulator, cyclic AMP receptor protein